MASFVLFSVDEIGRNTRDEEKDARSFASQFGWAKIAVGLTGAAAKTGIVDGFDSIAGGT